MLKYDVGEEIFFDTGDSFLSEEPFSTREDVEFANLSYDIWSNELMSVKERREIFLNRMGFVEESSGVVSSGYVAMEVGRSVDCSGDAADLCSLDETLECETPESFHEPCFVVEEVKAEARIYPWKETSEQTFPTEQFLCNKPQADVEKCKHILDKKLKKWWKGFLHKTRSRENGKPKANKFLHKEGEVKQIKVERNKKKCKELTALYVGQEICAHKGLILTMKFSPDGQYMATGGQDGVIRVWGVTSVDASSINADCNSQSHRFEGKSGFKREKSSSASVVVPEKIVQITESPLHEFYGHSGDILDLAWSNSNALLSASKDNTVRLWHLDSNKCQSVFLHCDYVTCIQFNPIDENYFASGSVDGKVRIWGVQHKRVVKWADVHDIITVLCHRPNGEGIITGSLSGTCRFYEASGSELLLNAHISIPGKRRSTNKITGIQFLESSSQRIMVTSEDSKIYILHGLDIIHKFKGSTKSGSQTSASLTASGRHLLSVGEDSRVYMWNFDSLPIQSSKQIKSTHSCEHFVSEGVTVALPWPGIGAEAKCVNCHQPYIHQDLSSIRDTEQFSLPSWFSMNLSSKSSATWPEEKLPVFEIPKGERADQLCNHQNHDLEQSRPQSSLGTWGLVIVTAGWDGMIRTFHNYGLPTKV